MVVDLEGINQKFVSSILEGIEIAKELIPYIEMFVTKLSVGKTKVSGSYIAENENSYYGTCKFILNPKPHYEIMLDKETLQKECLQGSFFWDDIQIKRWVVHEFCHATALLLLFNRNPIYCKLMMLLKNEKALIVASANICVNYYRLRLTKEEQGVLASIFDSRKEIIQEMMPNVYENYIFFHCGLQINPQVLEKVNLVDRIVSDYNKLLIPQNERLLRKFFK